MLKKTVLPLVLLGINTVSQAQPSLTYEQQLGKLLYNDINLSANRNQACASCHSLKAVADPASGLKTAQAFIDPDNILNGSPVSRGSIDFATGALNAPSAAYALYSPKFHWDEAEGLYVGGQFWNGRASDLAEQAQKPFLNPVEMAMPNEWAVVSRLKESVTYRNLFWQLYKINLSDVPHIKNALFKQPTPAAVHDIFTQMAKAIAEFESSGPFHKFNSKFDFVLAGKTQFTQLEQRGFAVFRAENKGNCAACHISDMGLDEHGHPLPPLFTDFTYDNIGLPRNLNIPGNPKPNKGLSERRDIRKRDSNNNEKGKHKVMSLRNIALTAPYGHNGVFQTLEQIVHFYNTRDTLGGVPNNLDPGFAISGWPAPEIPENVNRDELGNLGLTIQEEKALVAFMKTLTDDYPEWGQDPLVPPGTPSPFATNR